MVTFGETRPPSILDAGCGVGVFSELIYNKDYSVVGIDGNQAAVIQVLQSTAGLRQASDGLSGRHLDFFCGNILSLDCPTTQASGYDGVLCQPVNSIIGTAHDRAALLTNRYKAHRLFAVDALTRKKRQAAEETVSLPGFFIVTAASL